MPKASHEEVDYGPGMPNGEHCAVCANYLPDGPPNCKLVVDPILPDMWCLLFEDAKDMATTSTGPNNAAVKFRGKASQEMPSVSQAPNRFMHAAAEGKVKGVPKSVGKDFVKADEGRKIGDLPKKKSRRTRRRNAMKRGLISESAAKRYLGE